MVNTKIEVVEFEDIKELINSTSKKYNNFNDFQIINSFENRKFNEDKYIVYLNFSNEECNKNKDCIQVETIKDILKSEIGDIIKKASNDFDNFIGLEIIENNKKEWLADIVLKYKVSKNVNAFNLSRLRYCGGGSDTSCIYSFYEMISYNPTDKYGLSTSKTKKGLYIENINNSIKINEYDKNKAVLFNIENIKEIVYALEYSDKNIKMYKYGPKDNENWSNESIVTQEKFISYEDVKNIPNEIINYLEQKFKMIFDKESKEEFEKKLLNLIPHEKNSMKYIEQI